MTLSDKKIEQDVLSLIESSNEDESRSRLSAEQDARLRQFLEQRLMDRDLLADYLVWLQLTPKTKYRRQTSLPPRAMSVVLEGGLAPLDEEALITLALSPIALHAAFNEITEKAPDYWIDRTITRKKQNSDRDAESELVASSEFVTQARSKPLPAGGHQWKYRRLIEDLGAEAEVCLQWNPSAHHLGVAIGGVLTRRFEYRIDVTWLTPQGEVKARSANPVSGDETNQTSFVMVPSDREAPRIGDRVELLWECSAIDKPIRFEMRFVKDTGGDGPPLLQLRLTRHRKAA